MEQQAQSINKNSVLDTEKDRAIFISDFDESVTEVQIKGFVCQFANQEKIQKVIIKNEKKNKPFAYVVFTEPSFVTKAIAEGNGKELVSKKVKVQKYAQISIESNIYISGIKDLTEEDLKNYFQNQLKYPIISIKCGQNDNPQGKKLGYAYVNFEKKEDADKVLAKPEHQIQNTIVKVQKYDAQKQNHPTINQNKVEIKNIGFVDINVIQNKTKLEDEIKQKISKFCSVYNIDLKNIKSEDEQEATIAIITTDQEGVNKIVKETDITINGNQVAILSHSVQEKKIDTVMQLYAKNIKQDVTEQQMLNLLKKYGQCTIRCLQQPNNLKNESTGQPTQIKLQHLIFSFEDKNITDKFITEYLNDKELKQVFEKGCQVQFTYHMTKEQKEEMKKHTKIKTTPVYQQNQQIMQPYQNNGMYLPNPYYNQQFMYQQYQPVYQTYQGYGMYPQNYLPMQRMPNYVNSTQLFPSNSYSYHQNQNRQYQSRPAYYPNPKQPTYQKKMSQNKQQPVSNITPNNSGINSNNAMAMNQLNQNSQLQKLQDAESQKRLFDSILAKDPQNGEQKIWQFLGQTLNTKIQDYINTNEACQKYKEKNSEQVTGILIDKENFNLEERTKMLFNDKYLQDSILQCLDQINNQ